MRNAQIINSQTGVSAPASCWGIEFFSHVQVRAHENSLFLPAENHLGVNTSREINQGPINKSMNWPCASAFSACKTHEMKGKFSIFQMEKCESAAPGWRQAIEGGLCAEDAPAINI